MAVQFDAWYISIPTIIWLIHCKLFAVLMCDIYYFPKTYLSTVIWQIRHNLSTILNDAKSPLDVIAFSAISLGLIYVGSCNEEVAQAIIFALMDRSESELGEPLTRLIPLGLGLLYFGKQVNLNHQCWFAYVESITMFLLYPESHTLYYYGWQFLW